MRVESQSLSLSQSPVHEGHGLSGLHPSDPLQRRVGNDDGVFVGEGGDLLSSDGAFGDDGGDGGSSGGTYVLIAGGVGLSERSSKSKDG